MNLEVEIRKYNPLNEQETCDKERMLQYLLSTPNCLERENQMAHFTASIWTINKDRTKTLMVYHNIYDSWSWIVTYLAVADENEELIVNKAENQAVKWWGLDEVQRVSKEPWMIERIYKK